jgi:hypothetical protein
MWCPLLCALCFVFPLRALPTHTLDWDPQLGELLGIPEGLSQGNSDSAYDLHDNGENLRGRVDEDDMTDALALESPASHEKQLIQEKLSGLQAILDRYDDNDSEPVMESNAWSTPISKRGGARVPRVERVHPRAMRNVLDAMPPELITHILQGHRAPPTPTTEDEFAAPDSPLHGQGLSVGLDLDALSGMIAALRRQNIGERRKQTHRKLLDIGRK